MRGQYVNRSPTVGPRGNVTSHPTFGYGVPMEYRGPTVGLVVSINRDPTFGPRDAAYNFQIIMVTE